ncbi:hypothetical protein BFJ71_g441 [Fusarium oxysporum]|nr:hypothetical protein BFJ71_g441 [Fusarium oxysporum]
MLSLSPLMCVLTSRSRRLCDENVVKMDTVKCKDVRQMCWSEAVDPTKPEIHLSTSSIPDTPFVKEVSELTSGVNQSGATKRLFWEDGYRHLSAPC